MKTLRIFLCITTTLAVLTCSSQAEVSWDDDLAKDLTIKRTVAPPQDEEPEQGNQLATKLSRLETLVGGIDERSKAEGLQRDTKLLILLNAAVPVGSAGGCVGHP